ncbi:Nif3-like dinuclear metal center hexameric protein [Kamptonema cortianum]|nr:Nif3-like dinuclear metal center hexameric protein [Geitlerinema splendidum]MDK3158798.1 Nif3-like dinuclear metal center hexameric protein [Kamptonema cortianum]
MYRVRDVLKQLELLAPSEYSFGFDKIGLQVGTPESPVTRAVVCLDASLGAIEFAAQQQAQLLISHHPVIWSPLTSIQTDSYQGQRLAKLISSGIASVAAHTNWDCAIGGVNDALAELIGLRDVNSFGSSSDKNAVKVIVFVPQEHESELIDAMSEAGAGRIGNYSRCAFSSPGTGTFVGNADSAPVVGSKGRIEAVTESRLEMIAPERCVADILSAIRSCHPYEEPAIDIISLKNTAGVPIGRVGKIDELSAMAFQAHVDGRLGSRSQMWIPESAGLVRSVAVVGGAAADEWRNAKRARADAFVTGEVPHHIGLEASESGMVIIAAGHYHTEHPGAVALANRLRAKMNLDFIVYQPEAGESGRPV